MQIINHTPFPSRLISMFMFIFLFPQTPLLDPQPNPLSVCPCGLGFDEAEVVLASLASVVESLAANP
ncbi:hypothetical protein EYC84_008528 [Monilinia fructicola]|uniref:Uncharacterized protein n=1 Tax=Monilinia fructicola TaxID=38448 RepID=A0A5M9JHB0_MONFR|nr:hypothetical protein EYC84_008528 [Monilinia fructicola]